MTARSPIVLPPALQELAKERRWVGWRWITGKDGKLTKPPFRADAPHLHASSTDPSTWCDFNVAMGAYCRGEVDGIGFTLSGSEYSALDLDDSALPLRAFSFRGPPSRSDSPVAMLKQYPATRALASSDGRPELRCIRSIPCPATAL